MPRPELSAFGALHILQQAPRRDTPPATRLMNSAIGEFLALQGPVLGRGLSLRGDPATWMRSLRV